MNYFGLKEKISIFEQIKQALLYIDLKIYEKYSVIEFQLTTLIDTYFKNNHFSRVRMKKTFLTKTILEGELFL